MFKRIGAVFLALWLAGPLAASGPEETVRWIYDSLAGLGAEDSKGLTYLSAPDLRAQYFTARMIAYFEADDSYHAAGLPGCSPFSFDKPGASFDAAEAQRTLTLSSTFWPDREDVTASFTSNGILTRITYQFIAQDGFYRIDDIAGPDWRVSGIRCTPHGEAQSARLADTDGAAYSAGAAQYCYSRSGNALRLDVDADGAAAFTFKSVQNTGHTCEGAGTAQWTGQGWRYTADFASGACQLDFLLTPAQGVRLADPDFVCKPVLCGQRASLDGLTFPRSDQIDCAFYRE